MIRGTEPTEFLSDWYSDFDPRGVGFNQFLANYPFVKQWLTSVTDVVAGIFPAITGHSLGGALTQLIASQFTAQGGRLDEIVTFNSPGISSQYADLFKPQSASSVTHYVTNGDPVSMAGEKFVAGKWHRATFNDLNLVNNHSLPVLANKIRGNITGGSVEWLTRPTSIQFKDYEDVNWLNSPWYFHTDIDYFLWLAGAYTATQILPDLKSLDRVPAALVLFRNTTESLRKDVGKVWHTIQSAVEPIVAGLDLSEAEAYVPNVTFNVAGILDVKATQLRVRYQSTPLAGLRIEGKVELPIFDGAVADFANPNFILLTDNGFELKGELTVGSLPVVPGFLELSDLRMAIDTINKDLEAHGNLTIVPWRTTIVAGLGFAHGKWNYLELGVDKFNKPLPFFPAAFLQKLIGKVDHIADEVPLTFGGNLRMTLGPELTIQVPAFFGGPYSGSLVGLDITGEIDRHELRGSGDLELIGGLSTLTVNDFTLNWDRKNPECESDGHYAQRTH